MNAVKIEAPPAAVNHSHPGGARFDADRLRWICSLRSAPAAYLALALEAVSTPERPGWAPAGTAPLARALGVSDDTIRRHRGALEGVAVEAGGVRVPSPAWPAHGRQFFRVGPVVLEGLRALQRAGRAGWSAWRVALRLLPRLRAARHAGAASVILTDRWVAEAWGMGPAQLARALARLARAGLVTFATSPGLRRRISTGSRLAEPPPRATVAPGRPLYAGARSDPRQITRSQ